MWLFQTVLTFKSCLAKTLHKFILLLSIEIQVFKFDFIPWKSWKDQVALLHFLPNENSRSTFLSVPSFKKENTKLQFTFLIYYSSIHSSRCIVSCHDREKDDGWVLYGRRNRRKERRNSVVHSLACSKSRWLCYICMRSLIIYFLCVLWIV